MPNRCGWADVDDPLMLAHHDEEWGVPSHDDRFLFEMLTLEGAQAGLSWSTVLHKREGYRKAFADFEPAKVARFDSRRIGRLVANPAIVRNRAKVESVVGNARAVLVVQREHGSLDAFLWSFVGGAPIRNRWKTGDEIPSESTESKAMSEALRARGFRFVGPTICYAFMESVGMTLDHVTSCFRYADLAGS
jgi:DNA-3-methyladenine glycosylase I